jgi:hypothetical protein
VVPNRALSHTNQPDSQSARTALCPAGRLSFSARRFLKYRILKRTL